MDGSQYHPNPMSTSSSYSPLPLVSPHQLQHNPTLPQHTLPPLQPPQHAALHLYSGSAPATPRTPATPNTPGSANTLSSFPQMGAHMGQQMQAQPRSYQMIPMSSYQQQPPQYRTSSSMLPQASTAMSHPQPIAPAPVQHRMPQALRPMPPNGLQHLQPAMPPSTYGQSNMMSQPSLLDNMEPPTHVVGSQGRRGILPSAPGRPAVTATGNGTTKNVMIPAKDADGRFPCPHCTKTYLHAKHLKRHLLRHTGDRPYPCVLCRDTFSRSDILKRHFQKCSIRRGNPTGASHLPHAQAHLKKSHPGPHKSATSMSSESDIIGASAMSNLADPALHPFGAIPGGNIPNAGPNLTAEQTDQLSRSNSLKRLSTSGASDGQTMMVTGPGGSHRAGFDQSFAGGVASTMPSGMNPSFAFNMPNGQNGHSYSQNYNFAGDGATMQQQATASLQNLSGGRLASMPLFAASNGGNTQMWPQVFPPTTQEDFMNQYNPSLANPPAPVKQESAAGSMFPAVYPPTHFQTNPIFPHWDVQSGPLERISTRLVFYCFNTSPNPTSNGTNELKKFLTADNIKHFLEHFSSFQGHFPIIHTATFRISEAYDGLLLAMICIGAVYSDIILPAQVRTLMELVKSAIERQSEVYTDLMLGRNGGGHVNEHIELSSSELEHVTAIFMMQVLFTWNGTPVQREQARREFPMLVTLARRAGLTRPRTAAPISVLHQRNVSVEHFASASFEWSAWVEQEKRSRLLYTVLLTDSAMALYFNIEPLFNPYEVQIPLPADDAAWDSRSAPECAEALGLHGPVAARDRNPNGTRRAKQPEMHTALKTLMHPVYELNPGTTNLFSKFILVHALHVQLWIVQRQLSDEAAQFSVHGLVFPASGTSTPIGQNDWVNRSSETPANGVSSNNNSGQVTPVEADAQYALARIDRAFDKWKKIWDVDMAAQYPPSARSQRRFGFCRDAAPFYYLAKYLMQNPIDARMASDQRFSRIISLVKSAKNHVVPDCAQRGEDVGSVSDIDEEYGVNNLTLDMGQLFKPINMHKDSPVVGVYTSIGGNNMA